MPFDIQRTELVWPGKYDDDGNRVEPARVSLPFQVVERVNESHATREKQKTSGLSLFEAWEGDTGETFEEGWRNKLIWGDNLLVMSSLLEQFAGKVDLIYIDPPFASGADFSVSATIGDSDTVGKDQSAIEVKAYRDTWGEGIDSYLSMLIPRLEVARELLTRNGSLFLQLGVGVNHYVWAALNDVFGAQNVLAEIVWSYGTPSGKLAAGDEIIKAHEYILYAVKERGQHTFHKKHLPYSEYSEKYIEERFRFVDDDGRRYRMRGRPGSLERQYLDESKGVPLSTVWTDITQTWAMHPAKRATEETGFPTQKPEALLTRIVELASDPGHLVADFFCGSGTTLAVAEELGRRWIGCDFGRYAIHTSRKRLLGIEDCRPLEVLNLGRYERHNWQVTEFGEDQDDDGAINLIEYIAFILKLYGARPYPGSEHVHGQRGKALVAVGPVDAPVTIQAIADSIEECVRLKAKELHVLGWEWEMGLHEPMVEAKHRGVKLILRQIPNEVMERHAAEKDNVEFYELAYLDLDVTPTRRERDYRVELKDFLIPNPDLVPDEVREQISKWSDYVDYWAVDWNFSDDTFMQGWVSYRTRQDRSLALKSDSHAYQKPGSYRVMVKVIDIFGNDTSQVLDLDVR